MYFSNCKKCNSLRPLALCINLLCASSLLPVAMNGQAQEKNQSANNALSNSVLSSSTASNNAPAITNPSSHTVINFQIPAGSLAAVLNEFSAQSGLLMSGDAQLTQGKTSPGLTGNYTSQQALDQLLANTGIDYRYTDRKKIILEKKRTTNVLRAVKVSSSRLVSTTENSGSYTTGSINSATKLDLSMRETPQSVTVITRQRMDDEGMVDMLDVVEKAPGLSVNSYGTGRPLFYARGFSLDTVTEDGISSTFSSYIPSPLSNLAMYDRAEIVRGATGLMQGAGNPSAVINLIRKRPTQEFQAHINANAGSWNDFSTTGDISGSLTSDGNIRGRVVGYFQDGENFRDVEKEDRQMLYATVDIDLSKNTTLNLAYSSLNTDTNMVWGGIPVSAEGKHLNVPRSTFVGADWEHLTQDVDTIYASIDHQFTENWRFHLNAKYSNTISDVLGNWLMTDEVNGGHSHIFWAAKNDTDQFGADAYVSGLVSLFGRNHELLIGASTNKEDVTGKEFFDCFDSSCGISSGFDVFNPDPHAPVKPILNDDSLLLSESPADVSQESAYSTLRWNLADNLKLITGVRLDWYENNAAWSSTKAEANRSYYGGIIYDFQQNHSLYLSYTDVFKPQDQKDINQKILDPIVGENYELGIKGEYFDGLLNTSIAVFRIDQVNRAKELEDQSPCPTFPGISCYEAAGLVRSEGFDIEIQGEAMPGWEIGAGYTYAHVEYVRDSNPDNIGQRLETGIPERLFKINTTYTLPGDWNKWRIGAGASYQSDIYYDLDNGTETVRNQQKAYVLADIMIGYKPTEKLGLQARINNLLDKTYYKAIADDIYYGAVEMYGEPRNFMLSVDYKF